MMRQFCSIFIRDTVKQGRFLTHMVSLDEINMTTLCLDNRNQSF